MNIKKIAAIILILLIVIAIVRLWEAAQVNAPTTEQSATATTTAVATQTAQNAGTASGAVQTAPVQSAAKTSTVSPAHPVSPPAPTQGESYSTYLTNLRAEQNACQNSAESQYNRLYSSLQNGAFESYYNTTTGACYMKATGTVVPEYSASSTAVIYFHNTSKSAPLAYCTDSIGRTFADSEWSCTNAANDQTIPMAEFNALIYQYTVQ